jgi:hypothetical protein
MSKLDVPELNWYMSFRFVSCLLLFEGVCTFEGDLLPEFLFFVCFCPGVYPSSSGLPDQLAEVALGALVAKMYLVPMKVLSVVVVVGVFDAMVVLEAVVAFVVIE